MRAEIRAADERWELLAAARDWRAAGLVDEAELAAIRARYPDDRRRSRAGFRLLFFLFTLFAGQAAWAFLMALLGIAAFGRDELALTSIFAVLAALAALAAETATRVHRLRAFGVEEGLMALALAFGAGAIFLVVERSGLDGRAALFVGAALFGLLAAAALWRWAPPLTGALAAAALFAALYALPAARLLWIGGGGLLACAAWRGAAGERLGPAHRRRCDELFVVATLALYLAVHVSGLARDWFSWLTHQSDMSGEVPELWRAAAWTAMGALPVALVALGLRRRDRLALALGALLGVASATSAADALDLEPVWLVLVAGGAALIAVALAARRRFARSAERIAGGFTDRPLGEATGGRGVLEIAAVLATLTPAPRQPEPVPGFEGQGGEFGGGGASGRF